MGVPRIAPTIPVVVRGRASRDHAAAWDRGRTAMRRDGATASGASCGCAVFFGEDGSTDAICANPGPFSGTCPAGTFCSDTGGGEPSSRFCRQA